MYATIPEDAEAMQPKNQAPARRGSGQIVVALCVGVIIGALGTIALIGGPEAPSPSRATMELDADYRARTETLPERPIPAELRGDDARALRSAWRGGGPRLRM